MVRKAVVLALILIIDPIYGYIVHPHVSNSHRRSRIIMEASDEDKMLKPPEVTNFQSESQRRRNLPLSQLKRKPKVKAATDKEKGELRPLVAKTPTMLSRLRGEDYWIDLNLVEEPKKVEKKPPSKDQFKDEKLRDELVSPYTKNFISVIILVIAALIGFVQLNPSMMDDYPIINFPQEL